MRCSKVAEEIDQLLKDSEVMNHLADINPNINHVSNATCCDQKEKLSTQLQWASIRRTGTDLERPTLTHDISTWEVPRKVLASLRFAILASK